MKRKLLIAIPLLCAVAVAAWIFRPKHEALGEGYIGERSVTLWSGVAQVREPLDTLHYGDHVEIVARHNDSVKVRTASGEMGWIDARSVMETALWQRSAKLLGEAQELPVQARARTKVATNLRVQPGRTQPRLYQFGRGIPVEIVGRAVAEVAQVSDEKESAGDAADSKKEDSKKEESKKEEWLFVRGLATRPPSETNPRTPETSTTTQPGDRTSPIAGWIIGRFVELDLPDTVKAGTASANVRPVAWFELNKVNDISGVKPQYLVAGTRGADSQPCDFTNIRVYTWNPKKSRYETAYIENNLCGMMPVRIGTGSKGEPEFRFRGKDINPVAGKSQVSNNDERVYRLIQTVVRRIRDDGSIALPKTKSKVAGKASNSAKAKKKPRAAQ
jgi:SH3-like domain-containing protein